MNLVTAADAVRSLGTDAVGSDSLGIETDVSMDIGEESASSGEWHLTEAPGVGSSSSCPTFEKASTEGQFRMLHPYTGLVVLEKMKNALCKMTVAEVEELLRPFSEALDVYDPEPEGVAMVVEAYWISKLEA